MYIDPSYGWVKIWRAIWLDPDCSLFNASFKVRYLAISIFTMMYVGETKDVQADSYRSVRLEHGDSLTSLHELARYTGLSVKSIRTGLRYLHNSGTIQVGKAWQSGKAPMLIKVPNSRAYQHNPRAKGQSMGTNEGKGWVRSRAPIQEVRSKKLEEQLPSSSLRADGGVESASPPEQRPRRSQAPEDPAFTRFWTAYPRKVGRAAAARVWGRLRAEPDLVDKILRAVAWQCRSEQWRKDGGQFIPHPTTWLNQGRWDDGGDSVAAEPRSKTAAEMAAELDRRIRGL